MVSGRQHYRGVYTIACGTRSGLEADSKHEGAVSGAQRTTVESVHSNTSRLLEVIEAAVGTLLRAAAGLEAEFAAVL